MLIALYSSVVAWYNKHIKILWEIQLVFLRILNEAYK